MLHIAGRAWKKFQRNVYILYKVLYSLNCTISKGYDGEVDISTFVSKYLTYTNYCILTYKSIFNEINIFEACKIK